MVRDKKFYKAFLILTLTIALRNVIIFTVNLADSVMLGRFSEAALSGVSLVNQIQFMLQISVNGVCEGAQIFISRAWGAKDNATIRKMINISVRTAIVVSLIIFVIVSINPAGLLTLISPEPAFVAEGASYMNIIRFSYPVFALTMALIVAHNGVENGHLGFITSIVALVTNVFLNWCLIYGNLGFPRLGARGAAVATLVARCTECIIVLVYTFRIDKKIKLALRDFFTRIDGKLFRSYVRRASPVFFSGVIWGVAMTIQLAVLGHMGEEAVTANSISNTLFQIITVIAYASASAATVVISKTLGEGRVEMVKPYAKTLQVLFLAIGIVTGLALFFAKDLIINLYDVAPASREMALDFMTVLSVTVVGTSYQMPCHTGIVRGGGDTSFVFKVDSIFMWGIILPGSLLAAFVFKWSPVVVFIILKCDQVIKCAIACIKVNSFNWIKKVQNN